ncbi:aspartate carbamoyltransferase catalytic subunit [Catenisphaera adipataccumulans]|jgi:aspartate carbamoyltransferase catalytic subunit|uniref:Aspartate carbamoyltransferase n=1 Tax=Catenisphaera adipataccumulans TaxID=700500 RepID=A0A7W8CVW0_9FIRM|nr:aspartate carbamoyltransferase catalytic subunit [Catenisphaera adipataccumulans]MBB5182586.1 aspartate carbamoyltransferase catalytic subunit [Catenisphaera adipataccumulans]
MNKNSLLTMNDLSNEDIFSILNDARLFNSSYKGWQLPMPQALVANLFFEPSTRTHFSFESAQLQMGCKVVDFVAEVSSVAKGETLYDTARTFEAVGYNCLVIRHKRDEYFKELENIQIPIINAGDGAGNHPTQCLLDLLTMYNEFGRLDHLRVVIAGDILHSRVAHSDKQALERLGSTVVFAGPQEWERPGYPTMDFDKAVEWADVVMMLRIQKERGAAIQGMSDAEYLEKYGLTKARYQRMQDHAIICHPAPVNRGVEIDTDLVEAEKSRIFTQMSNGVLVRRAVIKRAFGFKPFEERK